MLQSDKSSNQVIASIEHDGRRYNVRCRVGYDGVEYVGRLWFCEEGWDDPGLPDRGGITGATREEVLDRARQLTMDDLLRRYLRALGDKRRFLQLRGVTEDILTKIRYMNQIAISVRDGLLDSEGAHQELELTEHQLHDLVNTLRAAAGIED